MNSSLFNKRNLRKIRIALLTLVLFGGNSLVYAGESTQQCSGGGLSVWCYKSWWRTTCGVFQYQAGATNGNLVMENVNASEACAWINM